MLKIKIIITSYILLLFSTNLFSQPYTAEFESVLGGTKNKPSIQKMINSPDGKLFLDRGTTYIEIKDVLGDKQVTFDYIEKKVLNSIDIKFFYDGDSLYLLRKDLLYLYDVKAEKFNYLQKVPVQLSKADEFLIRNGIYYYTSNGKLGIFVSEDKGKTWEFRGNGIEDKEAIFKRSSSFGFSTDDVLFLEVDIHVKVDNIQQKGGMYYSEDFGKNWNSIPQFNNLSILQIEMVADTAWFETYNSIYYDQANKKQYWKVWYNKSNKQLTIQDYTPGINNFFPDTPTRIIDFAKFNYEHPKYSYLASITTAKNSSPKSEIFGVQRSDNKLVPLADNALTYLTNIACINGILYRTEGRNIYRLDESKRLWEAIYTDEVFENPFKSVYGIFGDTLLAMVNYTKPEKYQGFVISTDYGETWQKFKTPTLEESYFSEDLNWMYPHIIGAYFKWDKFYVTLDYNGYLISDNRGTGEFYRQKFDSNQTAIDFGTSTVEFIFTFGDNMIMANKGFLWISRDQGKTFHKNTKDSTVYYNRFTVLKEKDGILYALTSSLEIFRSFDLGETWKKMINAYSSRQTRGYDLIDEGIVLACAGYLKTHGTFLLKYEDITDSMDILDEKLITLIDNHDQEFYGGDVDTYSSSALKTMIVDSHLLFWSTGKGLYYCKADFSKLQPLRGLTSYNMGYNKITFLDTTSQYLFVAQSDGLYRCSRSFFKNNTVDETIPFVPVLLYPNPGSDFVNITLNKDEEYRYVVVDNSGRQVGSGIINNNMIDIRNYAVGSYIIKVSSKSDSFTTKFIKN